jgi:hypothetical protein
MSSQERAVPHRLSLVRRLADLRRAYTGETDSSVHPAMSQACQQLGADERRLLAVACDRHFESRLLGADDADPLPPEVRALVLPDATSPRQQELDAAILLAASRAASYLHPWPDVARWLTARPGRLVRMVRPQPSELFLHLEAAVLAPLMLELLPRITETGTVAGLPGLRATLHRRHVELYMLGTEPTARVQLANVSYRAWSAALAFTEAAYPEPNPLRWLGNDPTPLTEPELTALATCSTEAAVTALASCLLRRLGLLAQAQQLNVSMPSPGLLRLRWCGQPTAAAVATKLVHPITGLPGDRFLVVPNGKNVAITVLDESVTVELHPEPASEFCLAPPVDDVAGMWAAWDRVMCAPSRWSEHFLAAQGNEGIDRQPEPASVGLSSGTQQEAEALGPVAPGEQSPTGDAA